MSSQKDFSDGYCVPFDGAKVSFLSGFSDAFVAKKTVFDGRTASDHGGDNRAVEPRRGAEKATGFRNVQSFHKNRHLCSVIRSR
jgi:hypothetical protein